MATGDIAVTEGSGSNVATYTVSEDAKTKDIQRVALNKSDGTELSIVEPGTAGSPSSNVMTVQGVASMTPVLATLSGTNNIATVTAVTAITNALPAGTNAIGKLAANAGVNIGDVVPAGYEYETVAASQTAQALGATGATGDLINGILVIPASTSPGNVILLDNATSITVFAGGASSVSNLVPFFIPLGIKSVSGAWKITTGASVSCIGVGDFT